MSVLYADPSALLRAYFADEPDHLELRLLLLEGDDAVLTSELALVELAAAVGAAERAGRLRRSRRLLDRIDADCSAEGPVALVRFDPETVLPTAREVVLRHRLRTLDALHLAVAIAETFAPTGEEITFVTRDNDQAIAAAAIGFSVR